MAARKRAAPRPAARSAAPADLDAAAILAASDVRVEPVDVPEWGGRVYVRTWTAAEREAFEDAVLGDGGKLAKGLFRATVCQLSICDQAGALTFGPDDIPALAKRSAAAIARIYQAADRLNTISGQAQASVEGN